MTYESKEQHDAAREELLNDLSCSYSGHELEDIVYRFIPDDQDAEKIYEMFENDSHDAIPAKYILVRALDMDSVHIEEWDEQDADAPDFSTYDTIADYLDK